METFSPSEMPLLTISSKSTIEKCKRLPLRSSDIFICSYPKSGTTWTQHIIISLLLLHGKKHHSTNSNTPSEELQDETQELPYTHVSDYAPFFEIDPHWDEEQLIPEIQHRHSKLGRRVFNTHLRCDMLPSCTSCAEEEKKGNSGKAKFIYIIRSPLDTCVSFYYHLSHQVEGCYENSLRDFFEDWMNGHLPFGSWDDHVRSYAPAIASGDVFLLAYEDMVNDLHGCVQKLIGFLDLDDVLSEKDISELLPSFTFQSMKKDLQRFQPKSVSWKNNFKFLRKGQVGDFKVVLSSSERDAFHQHLAKKNFFDDVKATFANDLEATKKILKLV